MAQYLKSLLTGVVLPYSEAALKSAHVRRMSAEECDEYDASMNKPKDTVAPVVTPAPTPAVETLPDEKELVVEQPVLAEPEVGEMLVEDFDGVDEVLGALETD